MRKQRYEAALAVAQKLIAAENAIDEAITRAAELTAVLPKARQDANLSAIVGQEALESAALLLPALAEARQKLLTTHEKLDEAKTQIGLGPVALGTPGGKPSLSGMLRAVDEAA